MCWKGGKGGMGGRIVGQQSWRGWRAVMWQVGKGGGGRGVVRRWQGGKGARVVRWQGGKGGRMVKWQGGRFLVLFKSGGNRVSPRCHLFVSDVDQQRNKGAGWVQDYLPGPEERFFHLKISAKFVSKTFAIQFFSLIM